MVFVVPSILSKGNVVQALQINKKILQLEIYLISENKSRGIFTILPWNYDTNSNTKFVL